MNIFAFTGNIFTKLTETINEVLNMATTIARTGNKIATEAEYAVDAYSKEAASQAQHLLKLQDKAQSKELKQMTA